MMTPSDPQQRRKGRPMTISRQFMMALIGLNLLTVIAISTASYYRRKQTLLACVDDTLHTVATMARDILPADYHDRITGPESVSDAEFQQIVARNNRLCTELGLEYIWSLMMVDGRIVFTTATSPDKVADNRKHAMFFEPHSNPELYTNTFATMRETFKSNYDKWGDIRVALLPALDGHGRKYLIGASVRLSQVNWQLWVLVWQSVAFGTVFFMLSMAVGCWVTRLVTRPLHQLAETIQLIATGRNDLEAAEGGTSEQVMLARNFNQMNRALQGKIAELETAHARLLRRHDAELRVAEDSVMMSEQRYRGLLNFAVDGILIGSHEGFVVEANKCICELFGLTRDEIVGKHIREMPFTPESVQKNPFRFDLIQKGETVVSERTIRRKDGSESVVEMHTKMMPDGTYQSIYLDITARKQDEAALNEVRRVLDETQRIARVGGWEHDVATGRNSWTDEAYHIYGVGKDFDVNDLDRCMSFCDPKYVSVAMEAFNRARTTGEPFEHEAEFVRANGERIWLLCFGRAVMEDGRVVKVKGAFMDITKRKLAEASLAEARQLLDEAQSLAKLGAWKYDVASGRVVWTDEVYRIHGIARDSEQVDLERAMRFYAPEYLPIIKQAMARAVELGEPFDLELQFVRASGERIWVRACGRAAVENGRTVSISGSFMDINERKLAEAEIMKGQEQIARQYETLSALLQNLTVGVFMVEAPSGKPLAANQAAHQLLGRGVLPNAAASNLSELYEAFRASDRKTRYPIEEMPITLGMKGVSAHVDDLVVVRPDGTERVLEIFGSPVRDEQGHVWASLVSFADITERKRIDQALKDSEDRYRQLFEMESDALFLIDGETGQIVDVNLAAQTLYGYSRDELLAMRNIDLSAEPEQTKQATEKAMAERAALLRIAVRRHRKRDGSVFPVEITARAFEINGRGVHIAAIRDITERMKGEQALRDSEDRYRQLFELESDAIILFEIESGRLLDVNLAAQAIYGYSREELLSLRHVALSADPGTSLALIRKGMDEGSDLLRVPLVWHRRKDGSTFAAEITARYLQICGAPALLAAVRDSTERRKAQELLESWNMLLERRVAERTAEVEKYARQLQALTGRLVRIEEDERRRISDVLHEDVQQTLVAARMKLGVVLGSVRGAATQGTLNSVDDMLLQSIKLTRSLVQDIAVPSVREGEVPFAIGWLSQQMQEKFGLTVGVSAEQGVAPVSENVYICLYRAVQEILFNVAKHSGVRKADVDIRSDGCGILRVTVRDEGRGFSHDTLAEAESGNDGFGLFSTRERIEGLGGMMEVVSEVGQGTTVILTVPTHG